MSSEKKLENLVDVAMQKLRQIADGETVVGKPIVVGNTTIIPISAVKIGFATGGSDLPTKNPKDQFGGGTGGGVKIDPIAFITITGDDVKLLQMTVNQSSSNAIVNMVPDVIDKITDMINKKGEN
ncbi:MAG: sporulation protein YtfJ [Ruminococcus sp.]|nr:sporulation protein YtfJ [Ruminococcus sp.]MCD7727693.1 sporulation protein YtfJ [Ruminococcus sp.]MCD7772896.1 sporulation protein YtfJ [Ruminococcus sp.]